MIGRSSDLRKASHKAEGRPLVNFCSRGYFASVVEDGTPDSWMHRCPPKSRLGNGRSAISVRESSVGSNIGAQNRR
jgi:hypothetical protein